MGWSSLISITAKISLRTLLLEVIPNALTGGLTNQQEVYVLRWIAGRHAGVPEFNPPYTIVK